MTNPESSCVDAAASRIRLRWPDARCENRERPLTASSVSWLMPSVFSRGQAIGVGLISERLRATAALTQLPSGISGPSGLNARGAQRASERDLAGRPAEGPFYKWARRSTRHLIVGAALSFSAGLAPARVVAQEATETIPPSAYCSSSAPTAASSLTGPAWNGWGVTVANTRFQSSDAAGLTAGDVPRLKLKWAFAFPNVTEASAQPAVIGGRVYVGSWGGEVYSLDAKTGCVYWTVKTQAAVRSAVSVGRAGNGMLMAYFGDWSATVYGVDAATGKLQWKTTVDDHPLAKLSSSPTLYDGRLYVGVASGEEGEAGNPAYECCTFRGSVVALDGATGRQIWKTYMVAETPVRTERNTRGTQRWGPSGAAVWSAPTVDPRLRAVYVATGNNYSPPGTPASDAVVALEIDSGKVRWTRQLVKDDTWNTSCQPRMPDHANCPDMEDPDFDFGSSPILVELAGGRRMLVAGQKSGLVYGLEPERGMLVWEQRVGKGGTQGGVLWGPAADTETAYVAVSDATRVGATTDFDPALGGGLVAIDLITGAKRWSAPALPCREMNKSCSPAQAAAVSVMPGVVFSGSADGHLRAYSTRDGKIVWDYDTVREYMTVNGIKGKGGTINNGGPAIAGGMVFINSGYNHITGIYPGNVLLAFGVD